MNAYAADAMIVRYTEGSCGERKKGCADPRNQSDWKLWAEVKMNAAWSRCSKYWNMNEVFLSICRLLKHSQRGANQRTNSSLSLSQCFPQ